MGWIEDIIEGLWNTTFGGELEALQGIYNFLLNLPTTLAEFFSAVMMLAVYPAVGFVDYLYYVVDMFYINVAVQINTMVTISNSVVALTQKFSNYNFPTVWTALLGLMLTAASYLMIYKKLKGLTILGFKIP